jgi:hypothetical protein
LWIDGLQLGGRAANDVEDFAGGGLVFERFRELPCAFGELARPRLHLVEQPRILDGNHGLVGEGLEEVDLPIRERPRLPAHDANHSDGVSIA